MRFTGFIGVSTPVAVDGSPDTYENKCIEHSVYGSYVDCVLRNQNGSVIATDINIGTTISVVARPSIFKNASLILYVYDRRDGIKWNVKTIKQKGCRLELQVTDLYNGPE